MQKVLVTGATGFIGNYVVEELLQRNMTGGQPFVLFMQVGINNIIYQIVLNAAVV